MRGEAAKLIGEMEVVQHELELVVHQHAGIEESRDEHVWHYLSRYFQLSVTSPGIRSKCFRFPVMRRAFLDGGRSDEQVRIRECDPSFLEHRLERTKSP